MKRYVAITLIAMFAVCGIAFSPTIAQADEFRHDISTQSQTTTQTTHAWNAYRYGTVAGKTPGTTRQVPMTSGLSFSTLQRCETWTNGQPPSVTEHYPTMTVASRHPLKLVSHYPPTAQYPLIAVTYGAFKCVENVQVYKIDKPGKWYIVSPGHDDFSRMSTLPLVEGFSTHEACTQFLARGVYDNEMEGEVDKLPSGSHCKYVLESQDR